VSISAHELPRGGTHCTQVVELKDELFREVLGSSPDDPSDTDRAHSVLVSRGVDTLHSGDLKVPGILGVGKRPVGVSLRLDHGDDAYATKPPEAASTWMGT
jgi:hypothetical protein